MPPANNLNPARGREFESVASKVLGDYYHVVFRAGNAIEIGDPPKKHKFDLVSTDLRYIGECKNYSWTETGNIPSAKMAFLNEAVFYLQHLKDATNKFLVLRKDNHEKHSETLAEYYYRINRHLLNGVFIIEIDITNYSVKTIGL